LEALVTWLNHEYVWDVANVIPPCWPHPHLVHEIAVLADQRHRAGQARLPAMRLRVAGCRHPTDR
jgi:hypothetical protein